MATGTYETSVTTDFGDEYTVFCKVFADRVSGIDSDDNFFEQIEITKIVVEKVVDKYGEEVVYSTLEALLLNPDPRDVEWQPYISEEE